MLLRSSHWNQRLAVLVIVAVTAVGAMRASHASPPPSMVILKLLDPDSNMVTDVWVVDELIIELAPIAAMGRNAAAYLLESPYSANSCDSCKDVHEWRRHCRLIAMTRSLLEARGYSSS